MKAVFLSVVSVIAVFIGVAGLFILGFGLWRLARGARTRGWHTVPGTVLTSNTIARRVQRLRSEDESEEAPEMQTLYLPEVKYSYCVAGREYTGDHVRLFELQISNQEAARSVAARYPQGASVTVHYNPADPSQAVLEPGSGASAWMILAAAFGCFFVSAGLGLFVRWLFKG